MNVEWRCLILYSCKRIITSDEKSAYSYDNEALQQSSERRCKNEPKAKNQRSLKAQKAEHYSKCMEYRSKHYQRTLLKNLL